MKAGEEEWGTGDRFGCRASKTVMDILRVRVREESKTTPRFLFEALVGSFIY